MGLERQVFTSARTTRDTGAVARILDTSLRNNQRDGLTAVLIYDGSTFAQMVEGERADIERCMERVRRDPHHARLRVLDAGPVRRRLTARHPMLLVAAARVRGWPGLDQGLPTPDDVLPLLVAAATASDHVPGPPDPRLDQIAHLRETLRRRDAAIRVILADVASAGGTHRPDAVRRLLVRQLDELRRLRRAAPDDASVTAEAEALEALLAEAARRLAEPH